MHISDLIEESKPFLPVPILLFVTSPLLFSYFYPYALLPPFFTDVFLYFFICSFIHLFVSSITCLFIIEYITTIMVIVLSSSVI